MFRNLIRPAMLEWIRAAASTQPFDASFELPMDEIRSKARWRAEQDDWQSDGRKIVSAENLNAIRDVLENRGCIIVEH